MMNVRIWVAFFSFLTMLITSVLIPVAYWGDKNPTAVKRLIVISSVAATAFLVSVFWGL
jgi:hypothetical protein